MKNSKNNLAYKVVSILICICAMSACAVKESAAQPTGAPAVSETITVSDSSVPEYESSEIDVDTNDLHKNDIVSSDVSDASDVVPEEPNTVAVETVKIMEGKPEETEMVIFSSDTPGETFFIVAGIHGDEEAGWKAADRLRKEIQQKLKSGTLYLIPHANETGIKALTRHMTTSGDLNRAFPGDETANEPAMNLAAEIFGHIKAVEPVFVLDLHEARKSYAEGSVGNTLIYTHDSAMDLLWDFLVENEDRSITDTDFTLTMPGKQGTINKTVSDLLGYPIVTVETHRAESIENRIQNQLAIVDFCLRYFDMI